VIEAGQFVKNNPQAALNIASAKGEIIGMWSRSDHVIEIESSRWQACLKLNGKRKQRKRGAFILAQAAIGTDTFGGPLTQDSADAICMGLAAIRRGKESDLPERSAG